MNFDVAYAWSILPNLLNGALVTIQVTFLGITVATFGGLALALAKLSGSKLLATAVLAYVEFFRLTPFLVQLFFLFYVLPRYGISLDGFTCGVIGLGLYYAAYTSEAFRSAIESVSRGQWEAAIALNFSRKATWWRIILPQTPAIVVPILANYSIAMFKESALLATITVNELLWSGLHEGSLTFRYFEAITLVGIIFLVLSISASFGAKSIERHFEQHR
jgi:polar amino acid transport system permease protein